MADLSGFQNFEVQFDKNGNGFNPNEEQQLLDFLNQGTTTDLFIISHGWNNDMADARNLYQNFFARVRDVAQFAVLVASDQRQLIRHAVLEGKDLIFILR